MTLTEFLEELTGCASMVKWTLSGEDKKIRTIDNLHCPISWVTYCKGCAFVDVYHPFMAAGWLGMDLVTINEIVDAADSYEDAEVALRNLLLKAVKLLPQA